MLSSKSSQGALLSRDLSVLFQWSHQPVFIRAHRECSPARSSLCDLWGMLSCFWHELPKVLAGHSWEGFPTSLHPCMRHCQKPLCNSKKSGPSFAEKFFWKQEKSQFSLMLLSLTLHLEIVFSIKYYQLECGGFGHKFPLAFPGNTMLRIHTLLKIQESLMILFGLLLHDWHQWNLYH